LDLKKKTFFSSPALRLFPQKSEKTISKWQEGHKEEMICLPLIL